MNFFEIPISPDQEEFRQVVSLDDRPFIFEFTWSPRSESWYLDFYLQTDTDPEPISTGMRITLGWPLLTGVVLDSRPPGELIAIDPSEQGDPGRLDLGNRVKLYYVTTV